MDESLVDRLCKIVLDEIDREGYSIDDVPDPVVRDGLNQYLRDHPDYEFRG